MKHTSIRSTLLVASFITVCSIGSITAQDFLCTKGHGQCFNPEILQSDEPVLHERFQEEYLSDDDFTDPLLRHIKYSVGSLRPEKVMRATGFYSPTIKSAGAYTSERIVVDSTNTPYILTEGKTYTVEPRYNACGGAFKIYTNCTLKGNNVSFVENCSLGVDTNLLEDKYSTGLGGTIYNYGTIEITGSTVAFNNNTASYRGGAVYNYGGNIILDADSIRFSENIAESADTIVNKRGGAICNSNNGVIKFTNDFTSFDGNGSGYGGVFYNKATVELTSSIIVFSNNTASSQGGAFQNNGGKFTINSDSVFFFNNQSGNSDEKENFKCGGAIVNYNNGLTEFSGMSVNFNDNSSVKGGAIENHATTKFNVNKVCFSGNKAEDCGGSIYNQPNSHIEFSGNTLSFENNTALYGGAIQNFGSAVFYVDSLSFSDNIIYGWGTFNNGNYTEISGTSLSFNRNKSAQYIGAFYNWGTSIINVDNVTFSNNECEYTGCALYNIDSVKFCGSIVSFNGNKSGIYGDILHNDGSCLFDNSLVSFSDNILGTDASETCSSSVVCNKGPIIFTNNVVFSNNITHGTKGYGSCIVCNYNPTDSIGNTINHGSIDIKGNATFSNNISIGKGTVHLYSVMTIRGHGGFTGNKNLGLVTGQTTIGHGGAIQVEKHSGILNLAKATFCDNHALQGGAIYNNGTVNFSDTLTLVTASDDIYNLGTLNWDLTDENGSHALLAGFQNLKNNGSDAKLTITLNSNQSLGSQIIATGDFSSIEDNKTNTFILTGVDEQEDTYISIGKWVAYNGLMYLLTIDDNGTAENTSDDALVLNISDENCLNRCEYWFDNNFSNRSIILAEDSLVSVAMDASNLTTGLHVLSIRFEDILGHWSTPVTQFFIHSDDSDPSRDASSFNNMTAYEYWFDENHSSRVTGNWAYGTSDRHIDSLYTDMPISTSSSVAFNGVFEAHLSIPDFTQGEHAFFFRAHDRHGSWSSPIAQSFAKNQQPIQGTPSDDATTDGFTDATISCQSVAIHNGLLQVVGYAGQSLVVTSIDGVVIHKAENISGLYMQEIITDRIVIVQIHTTDGQTLYIGKIASSVHL